MTKSTKSQIKITAKKTDEEVVFDFMSALKHPLKKEIELLRAIIKSADKDLKERIKWNAPSYYMVEDIVTFNPRATEHVHLVFHHPVIESIKSKILEGEYKGRRMAYFISVQEIEKAKLEIIRVVREVIAAIKKKVKS